ncbi:hypothetical protein P12x_003221 [Tundrisphaera lichenicola]|uniref:hypothetical protein n=1 Tax=Tundrisphaera lichenicola TaxID=2029860 RepID=UPI003EBFE01D
MMDSTPEKLRPPFLRLLCSSFLLAASGCGDDTVRGAGSIDIPKASMKSYIPTKEAPIGKLKPAPIHDAPPE